MTQEEKARRYDEAIERARYWEKNPTVWSSDDICQKLFPELKESEEEKTRKEIVEFLKKNLHLDWAIWLEKQVEQKSADKVEPTAWSEEDETMTTNIIIMLKEGASLHFNKKDIAKGVDWLKSLRPKNI